MPRPSRLLTAALALLASTATPRRPHTPHTLKLRFPRLSIPARTNPEACVLVRVATTAPFDLASIEISHRGVRGSFAVQHFLVHLYTGEQLGEFGAERGRVVPSRGCLDLRSEEHTSELQSRPHLVCRLLLEKKKQKKNNSDTIPHSTRGRL